MFENLLQQPEDPLLGVMAAFRRDPDSRKVDLGVGVYKTESGATPIPAAVQRAARALAAEQDTKVYVAQSGNERFNLAMLELTLGAGNAAIADGRARALQAPGGCGALRVGAELLRLARPDAVIHVSDPSWANHVPLLGGAGLAVQRYPYLSRATGDVDVSAMLDGLGRLPAASVVLLHGCCHNPSGADLSREAWLAVAEVLERRRLLPFVDVAYQGLGQGLETDAFGPRLLVERLPEVLIAVSCSKNFGLYRERTGAIMVYDQQVTRTNAAFSQMMRIARGIYSMPPDHGAELVARVCLDAELRAEWQAELEGMRTRIATLRATLVARLQALRPDLDYSFVRRQQGLFSLLPLGAAQIERLRNEHHVYMPGDGRINVAGISQRNVDYLAASIAAVCA
jgi:aspartate/tyrosine/aromatic aminotransferase